MLTSSTRTRLAPLVALLVVVALAGCGGKHGTNDPCATNTDCADDVCHDGVCASSHPLSNGATCKGNGDCLSYHCAANAAAAGKACAPGTVVDGGLCLHTEECAAGTCNTGHCTLELADGGVTADAPLQADAAAQADAPARSDASVLADAPPPPDGATPTDAGVASCPVSCSSATNPTVCLCQGTCGGHSYAMSCDSPAGVCTCLLDGTQSAQVTGDWGSCVTSDTQIISDWHSQSPTGCGFPPFAVTLH
jgi:hypothetical protein